MKYTELNLRLLQWKFDPHFLFNTLNNLYALSLSDLDKALEMIRRFKRLLQFSITDALFQKVKLSKEIDIISDYIQIEQIRYGSRLNIKYTVLGNPDGLLIVPFLLLPLVENCFRHGSSTDLGEPWIDLSLSCESSSICFETRNSIPQKSGRFIPMREEVMLKLKQRLEVIYPRKYDLKLFNESDVFAVKLNLDLS
jgi:LytS/YehU family sensor histidine kinase